MSVKKYKPGDRVFFLCWNNEIGTNIVESVEEKEYTDDKGRKVKYQWLNFDRWSGCEDYSCLSLTDERVQVVAKKYEHYDSVKKGIVKSVMKAMSSLDETMKRELWKEIAIKLGVEL